MMEKNSFRSPSIQLEFCCRFFFFSQLPYLMKHANAKELEVYDEWTSTWIRVLFSPSLFIAMAIIFQYKKA